jgi:hypothetical protein
VLFLKEKEKPLWTLLIIGIDKGRSSIVFDWANFFHDSDAITDKTCFGKLGEYPAIQFSTKHGDGFHSDNQSREFHVDSEDIGIIPWNGRQNTERQKAAISLISKTQ